MSNYFNFCCVFVILGVRGVKGQIGQSGADGMHGFKGVRGDTGPDSLPGPQGNCLFTYYWNISFILKSNAVYRTFSFLVFFSFVMS